jgi:large subunit ribosomal protein L25
MRKDITITAETRSARGKNEARRLRASGSTPGVLYGVSETSVALAVSPKEITRILGSKTGHNTIFNLALTGGENTPVMIVDWQSDPVKDTLLHVDMKRIDLAKRIVVKIPVHTHGEPAGVKLQGGLHEVITREIEIECLPDDIPEEFIVDVTGLALNQSIRAGAIPLTGSMKLVSPADAVISHVVLLKAEAVEATAEGAEVVAGATAAEPEVIKKGKKDEEGAADDKDKKKSGGEEKKKK